jgi:hypothetical protein
LQEKCGLAEEKKNDLWTTPHKRAFQQRQVKNDCGKGDGIRECNGVLALACQDWIKNVPHALYYFDYRNSLKEWLLERKR